MTSKPSRQAAHHDTLCSGQQINTVLNLQAKLATGSVLPLSGTLLLILLIPLTPSDSVLWWRGLMVLKPWAVLPWKS